ncbi:hypothetical protein BY996DRAFT_8496058, partial [Phakopsora pachyrhizi]
QHQEDNSKSRLVLDGLDGSGAVVKKLLRILKKLGQMMVINFGNSFTDLTNEDVTQVAESNPFFNLKFEHKPLDGRIQQGRHSIRMSTYNVDAGHISISSNLATMESYEAIKAKQNSNNTDEDHAQIESMMYDCFNIELKDTQIESGTQQLLIENKTNSKYQTIGLTSFFLENLDQGFALIKNESNKDLSLDPTKGVAEDEEFSEAPDLSQFEQDQRVVDSILEGFYFGFSLKNFDFSADITLSPMYIEDCLSPLDKDSLPSKSLVLQKLWKIQQRDLVKYKYSQVQNLHPKFMTVYGGFTKVGTRS